MQSKHAPLNSLLIVIGIHASVLAAMVLSPSAPQPEIIVQPTIQGVLVAAPEQAPPPPPEPPPPQAINVDKIKTTNSCCGNKILFIAVVPILPVIKILTRLGHLIRDSNHKSGVEYYSQEGPETCGVG